MNMTVGLLERFITDMEPLRNERVIDNARASSAPYQKSEWWDALFASTQRVAVAVKGSGLFNLNGASVSPGALRSKLGQMLGGGFGG